MVLDLPLQATANDARLGLAFALPSSSTVNGGLKLAPYSNSPGHYAKGTLSGILRLAAEHSPSTACRSMILGSISLP